MKIGNVLDFFKNWKWSKGRIVGAAVTGAVLLLGVGIYIGQSGGPPPEPVEQVPPYPTQMNPGLKISPAVKQQADLLARGAMMFIFFHETGHMLISEEHLPAVGPEEDVVDEFSTFFLTDMEKAAPEKMKNIYATTVLGGALFWKISAAQSDVRKFPFYDEHSPDEKRFFNILCIATGADPVRFIPMAVKNGVPENRLIGCADEYKKKHAAWEELMAPHLHSWLGRTLHTGGRMKLVVGPVGKAEWLPFQLTWTQGGYFQRMLNGFSDLVDLPEDIPVKVQTCNGTVNAFWSADTKSITICHEMFAEVVKLFTNTLAMEAQQQQQGRVAVVRQQPQAPQGGGDEDEGSGNRAPQKAPPPSGGRSAYGSATAFLVGRWRCDIVNPSTGMTAESDTSLAPDGKFTSRTVASNGMESTGWGRWSTPSAGTIRYDFAGVSPRQFCGPNGCVPNTVQSPYFVIYRVIGPGRIQIPDATCAKTG